MAPSRRGLLFALVALIAGTFAGSPAAQIYKWVDDAGVTHYGERPPGDSTSVPGKLDILDIRTIGNDPPPAAGAMCQTIQCQYERLRQDRLIRDAEWRRNEESRARIAATRAAAERSSAKETAVVDSRWVGGGPLVVRPRVIRSRPVHARPTAPPSASRELSVQLRR